ncbi:MAG: hypothetical protein IKN49_07245 [Elusimicrobiaceae bacterium]|nr:hypothetical protein [Elusimicrobiaceae bacterium]
MISLLKTTSYKTGAALAVGSTALWKLTSFASSILIAIYFGAGTHTDVYFYLIMLMGFGITFLQRINTVVLIPEAMFLAEKNPAQSRSFLTAGFYVYLLLALALGVLGLLFPVQITGLFSRFDFALLQQEQILLATAFFLFATQILVYYLTPVVEMHKFFAVALLGPLNALCPLLALLLWGKQLGIICMIYGFLAANVIQLIVLIWILVTRLHWDFVPKPFHLPARAQKNILGTQILGIMGIVNSLLPMYILSGMGAGIVSALNYCRQLTDSPSEIITNRVINVSKIELTENAAKGQINVYNKNYLSTNHLLLFVLTPLAVFTAYFAVDIVSLFFEHGHFNAWNAADTVAFLRPMIFVIILMVPAGLQSNTIAAWLKVKECLPYSLTSSLAFTFMVFSYMPVWGPFSYPYFIIGELVFSFILSYFMFKKYFPFINYFRSFWELLRLLAINVIALVPAAIVRMFFGGSNPFLNLLFCGSVFVIVLLVISYKSRDLQLFLNTTEASKIIKRLF